MYRPDNRTSMTASAKPVHHHEIKSVGLSSILVLAGGADEYSRGDKIMIKRDGRPPASEEG